MKITKDTNIRELIIKYPETAEIFSKLGLGCIGCIMATYETLEQGARAHGMNSEQIKKLISEIQKIVNSK